jgi:LmbE family N-acetylglucosaminyl deacetylase/CheY-like chemotaxis protein
LIVEDDTLTSAFLVKALERAGHHVVAAGDVTTALSLLATASWDAVLADIGLPGASGFDLVREVKAHWPHLPMALMTADARMDVAVRALRSEVDDFLPKPIAPADLIAQVDRLLAKKRVRHAPAERVLAIGAHPDDAEIGVGGTLVGHRSVGDSVTMLIMSHGARGGDRARRAAEAAEAARLIDCALVLEDLEDTRIPQSDPTVGIIERVIAEIRPTIVYTHTASDLHQDHRSVHQASLVAARQVPSVYCYESPSSTVQFHPARFVPVGPYLERKIEIIDAYSSQTEKRSYLDPDLIRSTARYWGRFGDGTFCEPLEVVRERPRSMDGAVASRTGAAMNGNG